ncbi:YheC/YheD family protein [Bacillus sp. DJP31]|uniref:YheC/YheD family endospore coat-associated protein n=1 Tax=Bacillus sp. DJP31 TaxID=3409789 RepID=UPI003BB71F91
MRSIGFLTVRKDQELTYFTDIASVSNDTAVGIFRFTPLDINPITEQVHGYQFDKSTKTWGHSIFSIPTFIYDRCFYHVDDLSKKSEPIVKWLKQRPGTTFLGYGLPNKWEVYKALHEQHPISSYLPTTVEIRTYMQVKRLLKKEQSIILKPIAGSQGNGILHIKLDTNEIIIQSQQQGVSSTNTFKKLLDFKLYIENLLKETSYLGQRFLRLQQNKKPFDVRILLQKNEIGQWVEQGRGVRIGKENGLVSNLHNGGEAIPFEEFLNEMPPRRRSLIQEEIQTITNRLPSLLEKKFGRLFELGLDIGVTDDGAVWLLDINSKPGRKVITSTSLSKKEQLLQAPLHYMNYLEQQRANIK